MGETESEKLRKAKKNIPTNRADSFCHYSEVLVSKSSISQEIGMMDGNLIISISMFLGGFSIVVMSILLSLRAKLIQHLGSKVSKKKKMQTLRAFNWPQCAIAGFV